MTTTNTQKQVTVNNTVYNAGDDIVIDDVQFKVEIQDQYFREVKNADGSKKKRDNVNFATAVIPFDDSVENAEDKLAETLVSVISIMPKQIKAILDKAVLEEVKAKFVENKDNWSYVPDLKEISLKAIGDKLLEPARKGRQITKATLESLANWYKGYAVEVLGKTEQAGVNGASIIQDEFKQYLGKVDVLKMFIQVFNDVDVDNVEIIKEEDKNTLQALTNKLEEVVKLTDKPMLDVDSL